MKPLSISGSGIGGHGPQRSNRSSILCQETEAKASLSWAPSVSTWASRYSHLKNRPTAKHSWTFSRCCGDGFRWARREWQLCWIITRLIRQLSHKIMLETSILNWCLCLRTAQSLTPLKHSGQCSKETSRKEFWNNRELRLAMTFSANSCSTVWTQSSRKCSKEPQGSTIEASCT